MNMPLSKQEFSPYPSTGAPDDVMEAIIKVLPDGYVPDGVVVRARASPRIFTCVIPRHFIPVLEADANVQTFSLSRSAKNDNSIVA